MCTAFRTLYHLSTALILLPAYRSSFSLLIRCFPTLLDGGMALEVGWDGQASTPATYLNRPSGILSFVDRILPRNKYTDLPMNEPAPGYGKETDEGIVVLSNIPKTQSFLGQCSVSNRQRSMKSQTILCGVALNDVHHLLL